LQVADIQSALVRDRRNRRHRDFPFLTEIAGDIF
jgi:hypothetical protein